jgi:AraC-like DNA-binding protein/DNA-binding NarL/FixJ family response regulator
MSKILVIAHPTRHRDRVLNELQTLGFQIFSTSSLSKALQYAQQNYPNVILCSSELFEMGQENGLFLLGQDLRTASIPAIFITSKLSYTEFRKAMASGASDYLVEPFDVEELTQAIATQLNKRSALEQDILSQSATSTKQSIKKYAHAQDLTAPLNPLDKSAFEIPARGRLPSASTLKPPLNEVFRYIESNYHRAITLGDVAKAIGYSPAYLTNLTREQTGQPIQKWIIERRMMAAQQLLIETDQIVEQIATQIGYQHTVHFFRQFRQFYGTTPQSWRNLKRETC